jgi:anaphase-promoting complex subunit 4
MDLIALATEDEQLHVFRLNGQEVLSADLAGDPYLDEVKGEIRGVRWKNDGNKLFLSMPEIIAAMNVILMIYCRSLVSCR